MKTTVELPDSLFTELKKRAAEERTTVRAILERALLREMTRPQAARRKARIRWVTVKGGLPKGLDVSDRAAMHEWIRGSR
ncbi:MAG: hypothetical protein K6T61_06370 [Bryobacteraceae bacterium]|nr:hypothetical protein [Bryobacteraceae bacterium]